MGAKSRAAFVAMFFTLTIALGAVVKTRLLEKADAYPRLELGDTPPPFSLRGLDGELVSLERALEMKRIVVVSFWATWCRPCLVELEQLAEFLKQPTNVGVALLAVNVGEQEQTVRKFAIAHHLPQTILFDTDQSVARAYLVDAFPTTVVIADRKVVFSRRGLDPNLTQEIERLIGPDR